MEKKLYPLLFCSLEDTFVWGSDEFKIADLGYRDSLVKEGWLAANSLSEVMDTYMDKVVGDYVYSTYGRQFPVQVKHIKVSGKMPLRVHPDDTIAAERYDALGREKLWYVRRSSADAALFLGFNRQMDAASILSQVEDGTIDASLNVVCPKAGDFYRIKPGTVHGAMGDIEIIEVSESSALDFCVCSWGEIVSEEEFDSALTIVDALDFIDYAPFVPSIAPLSKDENIKVLADLPQFTVKKIDLRDTFHITAASTDSFAVYYCLYGEATVTTEVEAIGKVNYKVAAGETLLVPSEVEDFILAPTAQNTSLLEILLEPHVVPDLYIDPTVAKSLPGEEEETNSEEDE